MNRRLIDSLDTKQKELLLAGCLDRDTLILVLEDMITRLFWNLRKVRISDFKRVLNNSEIDFDKIFDSYRNRQEIILLVGMYKEEQFHNQV